MHDFYHFCRIWCGMWIFIKSKNNSMANKQGDRSIALELMNLWGLRMIGKIL